MLRVVFIIEPASGLDWSIADLAVLGNDAEDLPVGGSIVAHGADVLALQHGGNGAQKFGLIADREVVAISQVVGLSRLVASGNRRDASRKSKHNVLTQFGQALVLPATEAFSQANQQKQRTHSPGNSEQCQEGAQLMRPQSGERLPDDVEEHSHRNRYMPPGLGRGAW